MQSQIENAVQSIKDHGAREVALLGEQSGKQEELAVAEAIAGDAYLSGAGGDHVNRVIRLQVESKAITLAIASLREQRLKAVQHHHDCQIAALRERAATERVEAEKITSVTAPLLEQLAAIEGCSFIPSGTPVSGRRTSMARLLESQALELERRGAQANGHVHLDGTFTDHELALAVVSDSSVGPSATEVLNWIGSRDLAARDNTVPRSVRISWSSGLIDQASYLVALPQPRAVAPPVEEPVPANGNLVSPNEFFGYSQKRQKTA
jgi:hypothetical protein